MRWIFQQRKTRVSNQQRSLSKREEGFALLFTVVIVSVVLGFALTILEFTIKQVVLSSVVRDSTAAYHVANAGFECIQNWRRENPSEDQLPNPGGGPGSGGITCLGDNVRQVHTGPYRSGLSAGLSGNLYTNVGFEFSSDTGPKCAEVDILIVDNSSGVADEEDIEDNSSVSDFYFPNSTDNDYDCGAGSICTFVSSRGKNQSCSDSGVGVVQREVFGRF